MMVRVLVIILADHLEEAQALLMAFGLTVQEAQDQFWPACSPTGEMPATHWWLSGAISEPHMQQLTAYNAQIHWGDVVSYDMQANPGFPWEVLASMPGMQPIRAGEIMAWRANRGHSESSHLLTEGGNHLTTEEGGTLSHE